MISNLNLRLATLALASSFMAFTAAQNTVSANDSIIGIVAFCSSGCNDNSESCKLVYEYKEDLSINPCNGTCMTLDSFESLFIHDRLDESTCYFWKNTKCDGTYSTFAKDRCTTGINSDSSLLSAQCFRGLC
jgi:hypothetical protein